MDLLDRVEPAIAIGSSAPRGTRTSRSSARP